MAVKKPAAKPTTKAAAKPAAKKAPAKAPAKKAAAPKAAAPKAAVVKPIGERQNKTQMLTQIAEATELNRKQVQAVLDELTNIIEGHVKK
jgi:hypothetical protein